MKKIFTLVISSVIGIAILTFTCTSVTAQNLSLQSSFNVTNAVLSSGNAGIVFTGTEYWVSKWYTDSIASLTPSGTVTNRFVIPGVTGVRAMTWSGSLIYAAVDNTSIKIINPVTKTQVGAITSPLVTRHLSYSAAANGGTGGLWVGDDFGELRLISLSGTTLQIIPAATHGLTGMWGSAYDSVATNGGPYLWIFDRGPTHNGANLVRIPVSTGIPDYTYNVLNDFGNSGIASGAYMSYSVVPGQKTLIALLAGTNDNVALYVDATILPITLVSFSAESKGTINTLKWKTASEQNSKGFELQRSVDGNYFTTIASIDTKAINGNSITEINYLFDDLHPLKGNNYYRLKQVDKNGKNTFSNTIVLKGKIVLKAEINNLYPNPVTSAINISLTMPKDGRISLYVTDIKGNLMFKQNAETKAGNNNFMLKAGSLATGSYILKAVSDDGQTIGESKFIKQ